MDYTAFDEAKQFIDEAIDAISECFDKSETSAYRFFRLAATRSAIEDCIAKKLASVGSKGPAIRNQLELF